MGAFFNFLPFAIIIVSPLKNLFGKIISDGAQHIQASDGMPHVDGFLFEGDPTFCFGYRPPDPHMVSFLLQNLPYMLKSCLLEVSAQLKTN